MADKEPAGSQDEPTTPADDLVDDSTDSADEAEGVDETTTEPTNDELAAAESDEESNGDEVEDREPVTVGAASAGSKKGVAKAARTDSGDKADAKGKGRATRKRDVKEPATKRTGPVTFVRESVGELRKVVYPTGQQLANYFVVVLIFVLFIIAYVSLLDLGFGAAMFQIFA